MDKKILGHFPSTRLRRNRMAPWCRDMIAETELRVQDLILPLFIIEGENKREEIKTLPDVERLTIDNAVKIAKEAVGLGIPALLLFPVVDASLKSEEAEEAYNPDNLICRAARVLKKEVPEIGLISDVALDPYTLSGHDGITSEDGEILNDETVEILTSQALAQAKAGIDVIAPSDMMDGRIESIRAGLDDDGFQNTQILSYTAKYASSFYGPFREAVNSKGFLKGDKKTYQMDPRNSEEALREAAQDIEEGADMIMVKPGLPYLDILRRLKDHFTCPLAVYHVSGEYAMLKAAAAAGALDYDTALLEVLLSFKRAGASAIATYGAMDAARLLND